MRLKTSEKRRVEAAAVKDDLTVAGWVRFLMQRALDAAEGANRPEPVNNQTKR